MKVYPSTKFYPKPCTELKMVTKGYTAGSLYSIGIGYPRYHKEIYKGKLWYVSFWKKPDKDLIKKKTDEIDTPLDLFST